MFGHFERSTRENTSAESAVIVAATDGGAIAANAGGV